ncbi:hypothetical protein VMCG_05106 [Cytospora schulzeri]|uniref:Uncharacterized protein n=1 Tax=Cytospora schulzeri TaxID=448051 RepID=A0A423WMC1_9PEZI|nr:hypothetical protein VMCG_05106 [Valsa malicola]
MSTAPRNFGEWARQIYGPEIPNAVPISSGTETPTYTMPATQELDNRLRRQIEATIATRSQSLPTTAGTQSSELLPQSVHLSVDELRDGLATQNHPATAPIVRCSQDQPAKGLSYKSNSSSHQTGSENVSTQPTESGTVYSGYYVRGPVPCVVNEGYLADDDTSEKSYIASDPCSSEASWARTKAASPGDNAWFRTATMDFDFERIERELITLIESYHGRPRFDCFPVRFQLLGEEQNRHNFFWRFGPEAYMKKYFNHIYAKNIWYLIGE